MAAKQTISRQALKRLPKVVLHDHLDGGLRPATIVDLADLDGYEGLPTTDTLELGDWFHQSGAGSLERYLRAFEHTIAVTKRLRVSSGLRSKRVLTCGMTVSGRPR